MEDVQGSGPELGGVIGADSAQGSGEVCSAYAGVGHYGALPVEASYGGVATAMEGLTVHPDGVVRCPHGNRVDGAPPCAECEIPEESTSPLPMPTEHSESVV